MIRVLDLCSGIGGFAYGLEMAGGYETIGVAETDLYCCRVLKRHWPGVPNLGDLRELDPARIPEADLWTAGFPCQPFSVAGKREGEQDKRNLWPALHQLISARRPRWLLLENVPGLLAHTYSVEIIASLASLGYVGEWTVVGAWQVGAPHRRDRVWIVAHLPDAGRKRMERRSTGERRQEPRVTTVSRVDHASGRPQQRGDVAQPASGLAGRESGPVRPRRDAAGGGGAARDDWPFGWEVDPADVEHPALDRRREGRAEHEVRGRRDAAAESGGVADPEVGTVGPGLRQGEPTRQRGRRHGDGGCPYCGAEQGPAAPLLGRLAHGIPDRVDRHRALGNAVVPACVEYIGRRMRPHIEASRHR